MQEKNSKTNKKRFTAIDVIIILIILAGAAVCMLKLGAFEGNSSESALVKFDVLIAECDENIVNAVKEGDVVSISNKEKDTATVSKIRSENSRTMTYNSEKGEYYMKELPEKKDLYVTLEADADITDVLIKAGTTPVKVGLGMPVRGKGYALTGYVVKIDTEEQEGGK